MVGLGGVSTSRSVFQVLDMKVAPVMIPGIFCLAVSPSVKCAIRMHSLLVTQFISRVQGSCKAVHMSYILRDINRTRIDQVDEMANYQGLKSRNLFRISTTYDS